MYPWSCKGYVELRKWNYFLQVNGVQSRCCEVKPRSNGDGFGLFATQDTAQGAFFNLSCSRNDFRQCITFTWSIVLKRENDIKQELLLLFLELQFLMDTKT